MRSKENSLIEATFTEASATAPPPPKRLSARWPERRRRQAGVRAWRAGLGWALPTSLDWARFSTQKRTPKPTAAFTAIQSAEATYYFYRLGLRFKESTEKSGKFVVDDSRINTPEAKANARDIPPSDRTTPDGRRLYYRVVKTLKVLNDVLADKIPNLQDLKDAQDDTSPTPLLPRQ